jgi:hypothetical protein
LKKILQLGFIFGLFMGIVLTIPAVSSYRELSGEIPVISSAARFGEHYGQPVYVEAPVVLTGISGIFADVRISPRGRSSTRNITWYLYVIQFEDDYVALLSRYSNLNLDETLFVTVSKMADVGTFGRIATELTSHSPVEFSEYTAISSYRNTAVKTFLAALAFLLGGAGFLVAYLKVRTRKYKFSGK